MKKENKKMFLIYLLITLILMILITMTMITLSTPRRPSSENSGEIKKIEIDKYPTVNDECTFDISVNDYQNLTTAGCMNGYTRYNINDIEIKNNKLEISIIYSDKDSKKTGLYINDSRVSSRVDNINNYKFGIFENKLFVLDLNNNDSNVLVFNHKGDKIYDLREYLKKEKLKELSTGDTYIKSKDIDPSSYSFQEGYFEFSSKLDQCEEGSNSKGSNYKVTYKKEKFERPEFINLVSC